MDLLLRLYANLLRLYPRTYWDTFADEMQSVFAETIADATKRSNIVLIQTCWRELRDLPGAILREHWQARGKSTMVIVFLPTLLGLLPRKKQPIAT